MDFKRKFKDFFWKCTRLLHDEAYLRFIYIYIYKRANGKNFDLKTPKTFNEKLQWLKLHDRKPIYTMMVDKYEVKKYVADKIGEQYIIPTLGVWNSFDEIDFNALPEQFVLKCTHDSGGLVICRDKSRLDINSAKEKINKCLKNNYFWHAREWPYKNVKPRIIAEEYIVDESGFELKDYKIWCFNGEPKYTQYIHGRSSGKAEEAFYDNNWQKQSFHYINPLSQQDAVKPERLEEMLEIARKLSAGTSFARIDFYVLSGGEIKFGEITFYPNSGMAQWHPEEQNKIFGDMIELSSEK